MKTIRPQELHDLIEKGETVALIDVRTPVEFREVHIPAARNVPLDRLDPQAFQGNGQYPLYVVCRSGNRAQQALEKLSAAGIANLINIEGGTSAWDEAGFPVVRGKKAISLERQVRIAAGFLVFVGSLLGFFVHPYWFALSAFVGAGLMFAGITDTCGMAMILAKMPWNQVRDNPAASEKKAAGPACDTKDTNASTPCCG